MGCGEAVAEAMETWSRWCQGALAESVWVWDVFWNWGEGKDWLLGSGEVN